MNCLWTKRGRKALWVTGRPQGEGKEAVQYDMTRPPSFVGVKYTAPLLTASAAGAMDRLLKASPNPLHQKSRDGKGRWMDVRGKTNRGWWSAVFGGLF